MDQEDPNTLQKQSTVIMCSQHNEPINSINVDYEEMKKLVCSKCQKEGKYILKFEDIVASLSKLLDAETQYRRLINQITALLECVKSFDQPCLEMIDKINKVLIQCTNYKNQFASNLSLQTMINIIQQKNYTFDSLTQIALYLQNLLQIDQNIITIQKEQIQDIQTQIYKLFKEINHLSFINNRAMEINFATNVTQEQYLDISNDHKLIAFSQILTSELIELYSVEAKILIFKYSPGDQVTYLRFSPDNKLLAAGLKTSFDIVLYNVKNLRSNQPIRRLKGHKNILYTLEFLQDSQLILTGGLDHFVNLWNINSNRRIFKKHFKTIVFAVEISPDKKYLLVHSFKQISIYDLTNNLQSSQPIQWEVDESTYFVKFSVDSRNLLIYCNVNQLRLVNIQQSITDGFKPSLWNITLDYQQTRQCIRCVGTFLISFGETIEVLNMKDGEVLFNFPMPQVENKDRTYERFCYEDLQLYAVTTDMKQITKKMEFQNLKIIWSNDQLEIVDLLENASN